MTSSRPVPGLAALGWLGLVFAGCAAFSSTSGENVVVEDAGTAGPLEAGASGDGATSAADGGAATDATISPARASILPNGDLETPTDACGAAWVATRTSPSRVTPGHESQFACRACNTAGQASFYVEARFAAKPGTWTFEAWMRDAGTTPLTGATVYFGAFDAGGTVLAGEQIYKVTPGTWTRVTGELQVPTQATQVYLQLYAQGVSATTCFEFDDVRVSPP